MTKEWDRHREVILKYYKIQGMTLTETMKIMSEKHGFQASIRAFRSRLKRWGVKKYKKPRQGSAPPAPTAGLPATMAWSVPMTTSASDPGSSAAAGQAAENSPASMGSDVFSPASTDFSYSQVSYDMCGSGDSSPQSAASPQAQVAQPQYRQYYAAMPTHAPQQQQQQQKQYSYAHHNPGASGQQQQQQQPRSNEFHLQSQSHVYRGPPWQPLTTMAAVQQQQPQQQHRHQHRCHQQRQHAHSYQPEPAVYGSWVAVPGEAICDEVSRPDPRNGFHLNSACTALPDEKEEKKMDQTQDHSP